MTWAIISLNFSINKLTSVIKSLPSYDKYKNVRVAHSFSALIAYEFQNFENSLASQAKDKNEPFGADDLVPALFNEIMKVSKGDLLLLSRLDTKLNDLNDYMYHHDDSYSAKRNAYSTASLLVVLGRLVKEKCEELEKKGTEELSEDELKFLMVHDAERFESPSSNCVDAMVFVMNNREWVLENALLAGVLIDAESLKEEIEDKHLEELLLTRPDLLCQYYPEKAKDFISRNKDWVIKDALFAALIGGFTDLIENAKEEHFKELITKYPNILRRYYFDEAKKFIASENDWVLKNALSQAAKVFSKELLIYTSFEKLTSKFSSFKDNEKIKLVECAIKHKNEIIEEKIKLFESKPALIETTTNQLEQIKSNLLLKYINFVDKFITETNWGDRKGYTHVKINGQNDKKPLPHNMYKIYKLIQDMSDKLKEPGINNANIIQQTYDKIGARADKAARSNFNQHWFFKHFNCISYYKRLDVVQQGYETLQKMAPSVGG